MVPSCSLGAAAACCRRYITRSLVRARCSGVDMADGAVCPLLCQGAGARRCISIRALFHAGCCSVGGMSCPSTVLVHSQQSEGKAARTHGIVSQDLKRQRVDAHNLW
jgi:hypothetical protein